VRSLAAGEAQRRRVHEPRRATDQIVATRSRRWTPSSRTAITGTHTGDLMGIPATGKRISIGAVDIGRVDHGQAQERWGGLDMYALLTQLGAVDL
jgi:predicted ester cyclase